MTQKEKVKRFREIVTNMADLYEKKNSNYGDSFGKLYGDLGPVAGLVPLHNKLDRATSLVQGEKNNFESLEDTFKDLACYAIMNLIEMEAQKDKECSEEMDKRDKHVYFNTRSTFEGNRDIGYGDPILTKHESTNPCEGCNTKRMLESGITFIGDLPCQWCNKNPYKFSCGTTATTTTNGGTYDHSAYETIVKGSNSNEK